MDEIGDQQIRFAIGVYVSDRHRKGITAARIVGCGRLERTVAVSKQDSHSAIPAVDTTSTLVSHQQVRLAVAVYVSDRH